MLRPYGGHGEGTKSMSRLQTLLQGIFSSDPVPRVDEELRRLRAWAADAKDDASASKLEANIEGHVRIYEDVCDLLSEFREEIEVINIGKREKSVWLD